VTAVGKGRIEIGDEMSRKCQYIYGLENEEKARVLGRTRERKGPDFESIKGRSRHYRI
jgi:hypothetical protein